MKNILLIHPVRFPTSRTSGLHSTSSNASVSVRTLSRAVFSFSGVDNSFLKTGIGWKAMQSRGCILTASTCSSASLPAKHISVHGNKSTNREDQPVPGYCLAKGTRLDLQVPAGRSSISFDMRRLTAAGIAEVLKLPKTSSAQDPDSVQSIGALPLP
jgi:hypothetical protein